MRRVQVPATLFAALLATSYVQSALAVAPPSPPTFSENAEVLAVEVPITVTVDSKPVRGLRVENFEVYSGKQRQTVVGFEVVDLDTALGGGLGVRSPRTAAHVGGRASRHPSALRSWLHAAHGPRARARRGASDSPDGAAYQRLGRRRRL